MLKTTCLLAGLFAWLPIAHAAAKDDPKKRAETFIKMLGDVKPRPASGPLPKETLDHNLKVFTQLDDFFANDKLTDATIAPNRKKLSPEQLKAFKDTFWSLVRIVAYPDSGEFIKTAEVKFKEPKKEGAKTSTVLMDTYVPDEDLKMATLFTFEDMGDAWRITDVAFDGASLVKDYTNQFTRIIEKDGVEGLLKKLRDRLDKERKTYGLGS